MSCSIYYINTNELPNHFTLIVFWCERRDLLCSHSNGDIFRCEGNMLFSHVKITWIIERLDRKLADVIGSNIVGKCDVTLSRAIQPLTSDILRVFN